MKKILLTEQQSKNLVDRIMNEQVPFVRDNYYTLDDGRYHLQVFFDFIFYHKKGIKFKGGEIDDITPVKLDVSYMIDIDQMPYGIKGITVHDIKGPKEIKTTIKYFTWDSNPEDLETEPIKEEIIFLLNWKNIEIQEGGEYYGKMSGMNYYGMQNKGEFRLEPDGKDGLLVNKIEVIVHNFKSEE